MTERGYEMHLVTFSRFSLPDFITRTRGSGIHIHYARSPTFVVNPFILWRAVKRIKPDVIHSGSLQTDGFCAALVNYHPILSMPWGSDVILFPRQLLLFKWIAQFTLSRADMITCDCEHVKKEILRLVDFPEDRIVVFPWGIDLTRFNPLANDGGIREKLGWEDNLVVIHDRQFKRVYGIPILIEAIPEVVKEIPNARFLFCGTGPLERKIRTQVERRRLSSYVNFAGYVRNEELPKYLNTADMYVTSSFSDGTSVSLLEAMACGLPTLVTDLEANLEWIVDGENGLVVPPGNSKILAQRMIELLKNEELRKKFGERNITITRKRANWEKNVSILEDIYKKLVDERTHAHA